MAKVVAYVLMVTEIGKEYDIINRLSKVRGVTEIRSVYGEFDIVARLEANGLKELDEAITDIRKIPNLTRTVTLISA